MRIIRFVPALVALLFLPSLPAAAQTADVAGVWKASFVTPDRTYTARLELQQDGEKVTGSIGSDAESNKLTGSIKGSDLTFAFSTRDPNGGERVLAIDVTASASRDGLSGSFTVDGDPTGSFSATRGPNDSKESKEAKGSKEPGDSKIDVTGTWALSVDLGSITASPSVELKQSGETVTGQYTSQQYGTFPLKGTVKGNQVEFNFTMSIEGNAVDVQYSGTVEGNSIKGTVNYGGLADGTFTGSKK